MNLSYVLRSLGGKQTGNTSEWVLNCWLCDGQQKLYFNIKKQVGYCQKCSKTVGLKSLLQEAGISLNLSRESIAELMREARDAELQGQGVKDYLAAKLFSEKSAPLTIEQLPEAQMPEAYFTLEDGQTLSEGRRAINYLVQRGFSASTLFKLQFGFCIDGKYAGRIIIPFWEGGKIVYWQARDYIGRPAKEKILNPYAEHCKVGKSEVLFNYDGVQDSEIVVICESWGSALAVGRHAVGINGKDMSEVQLRKLLHLKAQTFLVLLDHGAEAKAAQLAQRLAEARRVLVALLPWGDPNEVPKAVLNQAVADAKVYSTSTMLRSMTVSLAARIHR